MLWREIQKSNFTCIKKLIDFLQITGEDREKIIQRKSFPLNLPVRLAKKIQKGFLCDPILKQYVPTVEENIELAGYHLDPVLDQEFCITPKLLQKYYGRVLLLCTKACAMHCRFCFRQNFNYAPSSFDFREEYKEIRKNKDIYEVILSGGDPLSLSDEFLGELLQELQSIDHVQLLRFHSRFPVGIPERISPAFLSCLPKDKAVCFILHINHPLELDLDVKEAMCLLRENRVMVLSQTVLLRDINDNLATLQKLFLELSCTGIVPYYLHQFDPVIGGAHFHVDKEKGSFLCKKLREVLPGYAVPRYVQEIPKATNKTVIL